jgi:S-DNA-T family DNA segregation ATPase FtsK/SpoIIIE
VRVLPHLITREELADRLDPAGTGVLIGVTERDLAPVRLDLRTGDPHLLVYGDSESGKTSFLRAFMRGLQLDTTLPESRVFLIDLRRTLMQVLPKDWVCSYSGSLATAKVECQKLYNSLAKRLPPDDVSLDQLRDRSWWTGPDIYVVVDDYDLVASQGSGNPLSALLELIPQARDVGLHIILARRVAGSTRAGFEPVMQRIREVGEQGLLLSGDPSEGRVLGGLKAGPEPPGRGMLVRRRSAPERIQTIWMPELETAAPPSP